MSKFVWFVVGCVVGEFTGRWLFHAIYWALIAVLVFNHWPLVLLR